MSILKNIFGKKEEPIKSNQDFWNWFQQNEKAFHKVVKNGENIEKDFFDKLSPKLSQLREGYFYVTGMCDENTAELILTPDGELKNIVFIEELVAMAPSIDGWKFTALKPAMDIENVVIKMGGYKFGSETLSFYPNIHPDLPDFIEISIVHNDFNNEDQQTITNGTYIFLDNFIGELDFATTIDALSVGGNDDPAIELIPIEKLKDFLIWREKEFLEKYEGIRHDTENDNHSLMEAELENGNALIAVFNADLLRWDNKASHPWILIISINYDGASQNGMPDNNTSELMNKIENEIMEELKDSEGYLNIGRQTSENVREIYFACKDFRKPSKVANKIVEKYAGKQNISYEIYKDKYWLSFNRFVNNP